MVTGTTTSLNGQIDAIEVRVDPEARRFIRGERRGFIRELERIAKVTAKHDRIQITDMEVEYSDLMRERGHPYLTMKIHTGLDVSPDQASSYWDDVGAAIDRADREFNVDRMFEMKITVSVEWVEPDADQVSGPDRRSRRAVQAR
jgi:hypothetical protein